MKQFAYHHLINNSGVEEAFSPVVVVFDDCGHYVSHHQLLAEEQQTLWLGGTFDCRKQI